jgi:hypothetical protein
MTRFQFQWIPEVDPANFDVTEHYWRDALDEQDLMTKLRNEGGKGRMRVIGEWCDCYLKPTAEEAVERVEAYFAHNPSSSFEASEILHLIQIIKEGQTPS